MKKLGLIGGTSYHSTIDYYRMINEKVGDVIGADQNPELLLYSLNIALMRSGDEEKIKNEYLRISKELISIGAEGIIICAILHIWFMILYKPELMSRFYILVRPLVTLQ